VLGANQHNSYEIRAWHNWISGSTMNGADPDVWAWPRIAVS
jgi:hypothetical protein